jgi:modulator of FtsH protease HflK
VIKQLQAYFLGFFYDNPWGDDESSNVEDIRKKRREGNGSKHSSDKEKAAEIDKVIKKYQNKFDNFKKNNLGSGKGVLLGLVAILFLWGLTGMFTIQPDEEGLILRFGKFHRVEGPGLNYRLPTPIERLVKVKTTKINSIEVGYRSAGGGNTINRTEESLMLTGDENIVDIHFEVQWRIKNAYDFVFNVRDFRAGQTVKSAAESAMRGIIGKSDIALALAEGRFDIEQEARILLQEILDSYKIGIEVVRLQMLKVDPPAQVIDAFRDVQTAKADKERTINEAQAYRMKIVPQARGAAAKLVEQAKAYKSRIVNEAQGKAQRFNKVYQEYRKAPTVTRKRMYIETMEEVLTKAQLTIIDGKATKSGVVPYLPLDKINK